MKKVHENMHVFPLPHYIIMVMGLKTISVKQAIWGFSNYGNNIPYPTGSFLSSK